MRITVDIDAVFQITPEKTEFPAAADTNRYRKLAEYWDPFVAQETGWQAKADIRTRLDFDGGEFGALELMETLAHNNIYSYAKIDPHDGHQPTVFLAAGGPGAALAVGARDST